MKLIKFKNFYFLIYCFLIVCTSLRSEAFDDLGGAVQESVQETINQVKNVDFGEAESELAKGIDDAMGGMTEGMEFALQALEGGDAETALKTMEMLESTMDMAIGAIPKEEFMDFSKIKLDDFTPQELAATQSMMGEMMAESMGTMTNMMENMSHVEGAGFDMGNFMGTMDQGGFGLENMFSDNIEGMSSMFGEDMSMIGMMEGMDLSSEMMSTLSMDPESMDMTKMMESMDAMGDMSSMMSESMDFENFADMANMMDTSQMEVMTQGMIMNMMEYGTFDSFAGNMSTMGAMIKGEGPEGMPAGDMEGGDGPGMFFAPSETDKSMMNMMGDEMGKMGESLGNMSEDQMGQFVEGMGDDGAMMNIGEMAGMGMDVGDMAGMAMDMDMDMGDMGMGSMAMGDMGMGDMGMGDMGMGGMDMGGMGGMGDMMGGMEMGGMADMMGGQDGGFFGEAFGGEGQEGMFGKEGFQGNGDQGNGNPGNGDPPMPPPE